MDSQDLNPNEPIPQVGGYLQPHSHNKIDSPAIDKAANDIDVIKVMGAGAFSGTTINLVATEVQNFGDIVQINSSGQAHLAKANAIANSSAFFLSTGASAAGITATYLVQGTCHLSTSPSWTIGGLVFLSTSGTTGNTLTQTAPSSTDNVIQILGVALDVDILFFSPCLVQVEHT